jgi:hypothetical protein
VAWSAECDGIKDFLIGLYFEHVAVHVVQIAPPFLHKRENIFQSNITAAFKTIGSFDFRADLGLFLNLDKLF